MTGVASSMHVVLVRSCASWPCLRCRVESGGAAGGGTLALSDIPIAPIDPLSSLSAGGRVGRARPHRDCPPPPPPPPPPPLPPRANTHDACKLSTGQVAGGVRARRVRSARAAVCTNRARSRRRRPRHGTLFALRLVCRCLSVSVCMCVCMSV